MNMLECDIFIWEAVVWKHESIRVFIE